MASKKKAPKVEQQQADIQLVTASEAEGKDTLEAVSGWEIQTQEDMDDAGGLKRELFTKRKALEERLEEIVAPIRAAKKSAEDLFKPAINMLQQAENICTQAIKAFELKKLHAQREALAEVEASGGKVDAATLVVAHGNNAVQTSEAVSTSRVLRFEILDLEAIPEKYWVRTVNEKKIQAEIDAADGKVEIPGIKVVEDIQVRNKPRR